MSAASPTDATAAIPARLNLVLLAVSMTVAAGCLYLASNGGSLTLKVGAALAFSFINNTIFSLMHEAVHGVLHSNPAINDAAGRICAAFFPTSFTLQRVFHLSHHRNNRGDRERFDYYGPHENRALKFAQWYCILTGLYWIAAPLFSVVYALTAGLVPWARLLAPDNRFGRQTSAEPFLESLRSVSPTSARIDVAIGFAIQAAMIYLLDLTPAGWLLCYACFAVNWSSLQYTDHAFSPLDRHEGAWNLRVNPLVRLIFLNYHHHLAHHREPGRPWTELPRLVRPEDPNPTFWSIYLRMWAGPRPLPDRETGQEPDRSNGGRRTPSDRL
jgi:fatty acid desaturase